MKLVFGVFWARSGSHLLIYPHSQDMCKTFFIIMARKNGPCSSMTVARVWLILMPSTWSWSNFSLTCYLRQKNCSSNINILTLLKIFILNHFSYFFTHQEIYIIKYSNKETQSKLMASSPIWWLFVLPFCQCYICFSVLKSIKKSINIGQTHRNINICRFIKTLFKLGNRQTKSWET